MNLSNYSLHFLRCYPINTVLVDHKKLEQYMAAHPNEESSDEGDSSSGSDDGESSSLVIFGKKNLVRFQLTDCETNFLGF